jgi:hypothetical protein
MRPMFGGKVVKGKEGFFIFFQALAGFWEFCLLTENELIIGCQSCVAGRRQVHFMDQLLGLALNTLGHFIQDMGGRMHPAALLGNWAIFFLRGDPEAERTVTDSQLRCGGEPQTFELLKEFAPRLGTFPVTINDG